MASPFAELPKKWHWLASIVLALALACFFLTDLYLLPHSISLILPYMMVIILGTLLIGNGTGAVFSLVTIIFWILADTRLVTTLPEFFFLNLTIKVLFICLEYAILIAFRRLYLETKALSMIDPLTKLNNRRGLLFLADRVLTMNDRYSIESTLLSIDVDNFKRVNDTRGHKEGDKVLTALGEILLDVVRESDLCARLGGDEFCVLLSGDFREAETVASRVSQLFLMLSEERDWRTTLSIGVVRREGDATMDELLVLGDDAMYRAKKGGKNAVERSR